MSISLYSKIQQLQSAGVLELRRDPERHRASCDLGSYHYEGEPIAIVGGVVDPTNKVLKEVLQKAELPIPFNEPYDLAWSPTKKVLLAYAPTEIEAFKTKEELLAPPDLEEVA